MAVLGRLSIVFHALTEDAQRQMHLLGRKIEAIGWTIRRFGFRLALLQTPVILFSRTVAAHSTIASAAFQRLGETWSGVLDKAAATFGETIAKVSEVISGILRVVGKLIDAFNALPSVIKDVIGAVVVLTGTLSVLGIVVGNVIQLVGHIIKIFSYLAGTIGLAGVYGIITLVVGAIIALTISLSRARTEINNTKVSIESIREKFKAFEKQSQVTKGRIFDFTLSLIELVDQTVNTAETMVMAGNQIGATKVTIEALNGQIEYLQELFNDIVKNREAIKNLFQAFLSGSKDSAAAAEKLLGWLDFLVEKIDALKSHEEKFKAIFDLNKQETELRNLGRTLEQIATIAQYTGEQEDTIKRQLQSVNSEIEKRIELLYKAGQAAQVAQDQALKELVARREALQLQQAQIDKEKQLRDAIATRVERALEGLQQIRMEEYERSFQGALERWKDQVTVTGETIVQTMDQIVGTISSGIGNAISQMIVYGESAGKVFAKFAQQLLSMLISTLVQLTAQFLISQMLATAGVVSASAAKASAYAMEAFWGIFAAAAPPLTAISLFGGPKLAIVLAAGSVAAAEAVAAGMGASVAGSFKGAGVGGLATGGIVFQRGIFELAERGPEVVLPLEQLPQFLPPQEEELHLKLKLVGLEDALLKAQDIRIKRRIGRRR